MPGSLTSGFIWNRRRGETFPAFPAHAQPAIYVSGKRPINIANIQATNLFSGLFCRLTRAVFSPLLQVSWQWFQAVREDVTYALVIVTDHYDITGDNIYQRSHWVCCDIIYHCEKYLKRESREISFVHNSHFHLSNRLKFRTEHWENRSVKLIRHLT